MANAQIFVEADLPPIIESKNEEKQLKQAIKDVQHAEKAEVKAQKAEHHSHSVSVFVLASKGRNKGEEDSMALDA